MSPIMELLQSDAAINMTLALLHTLWQAMLIVAVLFVILKNTPGQRSELRYRVSVVSLFLIVVCWLGTFSILQYEGPLPTEPIPAAEGAPLLTPSTDTAEMIETVPAMPPSGRGVGEPAASRAAVEALVPQRRSIGYAGWAMLCWAAGVCVMVVRMFRALVGAAKLTREAADIDDPAIVALFASLCERMPIGRRVRLAVSETLAHPGVIGFFRPVLLIPASILSEISTDDLQAILAHELAHIRRFDYMVNFCQMVVESVLFFNPAVWWLSRRIRIEREACCDAAGVAAAGERVQYAKVLFEQIARTAAPAAMAGFSDGHAGESEERIRRIIHPQHKPGMKVGWLKAACWLATAGIVLLGLYKTTDVAVAFAAHIMTPAERIEAMKQINDVYAVEHSLFDEADKVTVRGQLVTADSGELPVRTGENCQGNQTTQLDVRINLGPYEDAHGWPTINADGSFEFQTRLKRFYIIVQPRKEYAVGFYGPFEFDPNEVAEGLELSLERGFTSEILFVNEQSEPVENVQVTGGYPTPPEYGGWHHTLKSVSGVDGAAVIEHAADEWANFSCEAAGYVKEARQKIRLKPDEPYLWQLTSTPSTVIRVVTDANDQPVNGAGVNLYGKEYSQIDSYHVERPAYMTDEDGWVQLESLSESETYLVMVHGNGYQRQYVHIQGGDDVTVRLKASQPVTGKITGDLSGLEQDETGSFFEFSNVVRLAEYYTSSDWSGENKVYVEVVDGEGHFRIDGYYGHALELKIGSKTHKITINEDDIRNVVIDIPAPSSYETKTVRFRFMDAVSSEVLPLTGKFKLTYREKPGDNYLKSHAIEIVDGYADVDMVVPNHIQWHPSPETGWFFYNEWKDISADYEGVETISCYPAGAIFGTITHPLEEFCRVFVSIRTAKKSSLLEANRSQSPIVEFEDNIDLRPDGSYYIAPVPLDGEYAVSVSHKNLYWLSGDIKLSEENPIAELNIVLPSRLADIRGQLLGPDGEAIAGAGGRVHTRARHGGRTHNNTNWSTGPDGRFELTGVNPDAAIEHSISFDVPGYIRKSYPLKSGKFNRIVLEKALQVRGTVYDKDSGEPVSGVTVNFWPQDSPGYESFEVTTNARGEFTADRFGDASYYFSLRKDGYLGGWNSRENRIDPATDSDVELSIQTRSSQ